jgi:PhzF family phenazine biosynthesis protein
MQRSRAFAQVDVFSRTPYLGNPVAVVLDGADLTDEDMARLARWTNLSETTFVLPPTTELADYRLRIFTPGGELPFAGHPTLGSACAWLANGGTPRESDQLIQECSIGLVAVRRQGDEFAFAAPPLVRSGPLEESHVQEVAAAFRVRRDQVIAHQWVDTGPGWAIVQLATAAEVLALEPDLTRIPTAMVGAIGAYPTGSEFSHEMRTFAPAVAVPEDPGCGSMSAGVGRWLLTAQSARQELSISQGSRVARAATITVTREDTDQIWVGGPATVRILGTILM